MYVSDSSHLLLWPGRSGAKSNPYVGNFAQALENEGFRVESFSTTKWRGGFCKHNALVVHWPESAAQGKHKLIQKFWFSVFLCTLRIYRARGRQVIWVYHNISPHDKKHINYQPFSMLVDGLISPSFTGLDLCKKEFPHLSKVPSAVSRIGRYVTPPEAKPVEIDLPETKHILLSFGYIRPYKGLEQLIDSVIQLDRDDVTLVVCGQAIDHEYTQQLTEVSEKSDKIRFDIGFVSDENLQHYFRHCTAAVFAFSNLLHSSSVIAARSAGLPVLAPAVGSINEYAELDPGLHVSDSPVTSKCISQFLDNCSISPPGLPEEHFGWDSIGRQTADLIWRVLESPRRADNDQ